MSRWNPDRWQQVGVNSAGDPVYARGAPGDASLDSLTKAQLQELAAERGLPTSGTKAELIERLS